MICPVCKVSCKGPSRLAVHVWLEHWKGDIDSCSCQDKRFFTFKELGEHLSSLSREEREAHVVAGMTKMAFEKKP